MLLHDRAQALAIAPLWRLGFRPFFLGGAVFAVLALGLWLAALQGWLGAWQAVGGSLAWHRHELPFGFALAEATGVAVLRLECLLCSQTVPSVVTMLRGGIAHEARLLR